MTDDGYRLPGVSRAGVPQQLQLKPHESFTPEAIHPINPVRLTVGEPPEAFKATPPDWTDRPDLPCLNRWDEWDAPDAATFRKVVLPGCMSCPVRVECLEAALAEEGDERAVFRSGVRGGLRPKERYKLTQQLPPQPDVCTHGHPMGGDGEAYWYGSRNQWACATCVRARKEARRDAA